MPLPLPDLVSFSKYNNWDIYLNVLYEIYLIELVDSGVHYSGLPIHYRFIPMTDGKGFGFWHLISEGKDEDDRIPALDRCERIRWIKWMILEADSNTDIRHFETKRGSSINVVLWNYVIHYAVILGKRSGYYVLITAFSTNPGRERSFMQDWLDFQING